MKDVKRIAVMAMWLAYMIVARVVAMDVDPQVEWDTVLGLIDYLSYSELQINELVLQISTSVEHAKSMEFKLHDHEFGAIMEVLSIRAKIFSLMNTELLVDVRTNVRLTHVITKLKYMAQHRKRHMAATESTVEVEAAPPTPAAEGGLGLDDDYTDSDEQPAIDPSIVDEAYLLQDVRLHESTYHQDKACQLYIRTLFAWVMQRYVKFYQKYVVIIFESVFKHVKFVNSKSVIGKAFQVESRGLFVDRSPPRPRSAFSVPLRQFGGRPPQRTLSAPPGPLLVSPMARSASHSPLTVTFPDSLLSASRQSPRSSPELRTEDSVLSPRLSGHSSLSGLHERSSAFSPLFRFPSSPSDARCTGPVRTRSLGLDLDLDDEESDEGNDTCEMPGGMSPSSGLIYRPSFDSSRMHLTMRDQPSPTIMPQSKTRWDTLVSPKCRPYYLTFGRLFFSYAYVLLESGIEREHSMKFVTDFGLDINEIYVPGFDVAQKSVFRQVMKREYTSSRSAARITTPVDCIIDVKKNTVTIVQSHANSVIMDLLVALKISDPVMPRVVDEWTSDYKLWRHQGDAIGVLHRTTLSGAPTMTSLSSKRSDELTILSSVSYVPAKYHTIYHSSSPHLLAMLWYAVPDFHLVEERQESAQDLVPYLPL